MKNLYLKILSIIILFFIYNSVLFSQSGIILKSYDTKQYPTISTEVFIFDSDINYPIQSYTEKNIVVMDNGITPNNIVLTNPPQNIEPVKSYDLIFDLGIESSADISQSRFQTAINLFKQLIALIDTTKCEMSLTSFDAINYINQGFTNSQASVLAALNILTPEMTSMLDQAFLSNPAGCIEFMKKAKFNKIAVLITDGAGLQSKSEILNQLKSENIKVFVLVVGKPISTDLLDIVNQTGGTFYDNIKSSDDLKLIAKYIYGNSINFLPSVISWDVPFTCADVHDVEINVPAKNYQVKFNYNVVSHKKPIITTNPKALGFSYVNEPLLPKQKDISLTAVNSDIRITKFSIQDPRYTIVNGDVTSGEIIIKQNESHTLTIRYSPSDSAITFTTLQITSDACLGNEIYLTGGFPNTPPVDRTIKLLTPECKTTLVPKDTFSIIWTGLLPQDVIQLEYSLDNGRNWDTLARNITDLKYLWTVPDVNSDECLIRAIQLWPNNVGRTLDLRHKKDVNSAFFNNDGNFVITASSDGTVGIWNSNTGKLIHNLTGHSDIVNYATFNNLANRAASVGADQNLIIWDVATGTEIVRKIFNSNVLSVKYSPNDDYLVVAAKNGHTYILDATDLSIKQDINSYPNGLTWYAEFSPNGQYVLTAGNNGLVKVWEWETNINTPVKIYDVRTNGYGNAIHATYNYNASKVAVCDLNSKKVTVFDAATGDTLYTLTHKVKPDDNITIFSTSFYHDAKYGELILTAAEDNVRLWDANKGIEAPPHIIQEHTEAVLTAVFNFDAKRILTASRDFTAKIWNLEQRALQMDTTDCLFRIKPIKIAIADVQFPEIPVNDSKDSTILNFIVNKTDFNYQIRNIELANTSGGDFQILSNIETPFILDTLKPFNISILFRPTKVGLITDTIKITTPGGIYSSVLSGIGIDRSLVSYFNLIDFGQVELGDSKDTIINILVENKSLSDVKITGVKLQKPDTLHFNIISKTQKDVLRPNETMGFTIRYTPMGLEVNNGTLVIENDGLISPLKIGLLGEGIKTRMDTATIVVGDATGKPGDIIEVPIYIKNLSKLGLRETIKGFTTNLRFNKSMLKPLDFYPEWFDGQDRVMKITLPSKFGADSILVKLKFKVALGNDTLTPLKIEYTEPIGLAKILIFEQSGEFKLSGYCMQGTPRLFDENGRVFLNKTFPNPTNGIFTINFSLIEDGFTRLYLVDLTGRIIKELANSIMQKGEYNYQVNSADFPSGQYRLILETPTRKFTQSLIIQR
jgi:WD40 repeat protein